MQIKSSYQSPSLSPSSTQSYQNPNRLLREKSPYLLQHAYNPVDWFPWGDEAFQKAKNEDKPIFLSIGYSTCYWCHVMEREVFENSAIAELMNTKLVCIKVDREERPDIDRVYMTAVQALTGSGGWPMSVFMTPDRKPFFGGTYIPPKAQYGRPGFPELVNRIDELWHNERSRLLESSDEITAMLRRGSPSPSGADVGDPVLTVAFERFSRAFDPTHAGFGGAPKFPRPATFDFLLRYYARTGNETALHMTLASLRAMARGGMYDQIGGGFHRYSVDEQWRVPHFEKMLYDQAQLAVAYLEAFQVTRDAFFSDIAKETLNFVLREMTSPEGAFTSALDAESALEATKPEEKEEGEFYLWKSSDITRLLPPADAQIVAYYFGIADSGNALHDPHQIFSGKNILYAAHPIGTTAEYFRTSPQHIERVLTESRIILLNAREQRPRPLLDDKIVTAWNGLMISAFAKAYQILGDRRYLTAAQRAAGFISTHLVDTKDNTLLRRYRDGDARFEAGLQDYAFTIQGLIDLYEASFTTRWLEEAVRHSHRQIELFQDLSSGGFFDSTENDPTLLIRTKEGYDGAEPTGNSVAAMNFLRLGHITDNKEWTSVAAQTITAFSAYLSSSPDIMPKMLAALCHSLTTPAEIIIAGTPDATDTQEMIRTIHSHFIPFKALLLADGAMEQEKISLYLPFIKEMKMTDGRATAYVCENYACQLPVAEISALEVMLEKYSAKRNVK